MTVVDGLQPRGLRVNLATYWVLSKPRIWLVFALEGLAGSLLAWHAPDAFPWLAVFTVVTAIALGGAGAESLTNVLDRTIDAAMLRTRARPLPRGMITPAAAVAFGLVCVGISLVLAGALGPVPLLFLLIGLINNVIIYSALTKRATPWSIVLGALAGAIPVFVGFAAVGLPISPSGWLLGGVVLCWIPVHIWSLAWAYREDYARAGVPMAPVVWRPQTFKRAWCTAVALMVIASAVFNTVALRGAPALMADAGAGLVGILGGQWAVGPTTSRAHRVFRVANAYLAGLFLLVIAVRV